MQGLVDQEAGGIVPVMQGFHAVDAQFVYDEMHRQHDPQRPPAVHRQRPYMNPGLREVVPGQGRRHDEVCQAVQHHAPDVLALHPVDHVELQREVREEVR